MRGVAAAPIVIVGGLAVICGIFAASSAGDSRRHISAEEIARAPTDTEWEGLFDSRHIRVDALPSRISRVLASSTGQLIIPDRQRRGILVFDSMGKLETTIPIGETASIRAASAIGIDDTDTLFVADPAKDTMFVLRPPDYVPARTFPLPVPVSSLDFLSGRIIGYSPGREEVFVSFDRRGKRLSSTHRVEDAKARIFLARVRTGGLVAVSDTYSIGVHPAAFEFVKLSDHSDVLEVLEFTPSEWTPRPVPFPSALDPYDYRPAHEGWFDSFLHIGKPYVLSDTLLLLTIFKSSGLAEVEQYVNVFSLDGGLIAAGIRVPSDARVVGVRDHRLFVARDASISDENVLTPPVLMEYQFHRTDARRARDDS